MNLLLDTHVAIWALGEPDKLPARIRDAILDAATVHVSAASIWEITIKFALGRDSAPPYGGGDALRWFQEAGFDILAVSGIHAAKVESLPPLHADPFDRLLVAQAQCENLTLVSADRSVAAYFPAILTW
ncbi:MAG: type II toxin-antitoxin system VapC family toxin [Notoacmeibacter sp.]|nr:type II toxin-antitoxin system VapC family toxin [Notoacmeibacter sp.]MCC0033012.1 type II toxin-antitoxin system VapC family toxin [Brucellaceae bacterium]